VQPRLVVLEPPARQLGPLPPTDAATSAGQTRNRPGTTWGCPDPDSVRSGNNTRRQNLALE
jgi:hypothetical protein